MKKFKSHSTVKSIFLLCIILFTKNAALAQSTCSFVVSGGSHIEHGLAIDNSGNTYNIFGNSNGLNSTLLIKIDQNGSQIWSFPCPDYNINVAIDHLNNIYIGGTLHQNNLNFDFDPGPNTVTISPGLFVLKVSSTGNFVWVKSMPSMGFSSGDLRVYSINTTTNACYLYGQFINNTIDFDPGPANYTLTSSSNDGDYFVCKLDLSGAFNWVRLIEGAPSNSNFGLSSFPTPLVKTDAAGNIYLTGTYSYLTDFDPTPNVYNLPITTSNSSTTTYTDNAFVMKLNSSGGFTWAKGFLADISGLEISSTNDVFLTGVFRGTVDFDPGPNTYTVSSIFPYADQPCIIKLNNMGDFSWVKIHPAAVGSNYRVISAIDPYDNIYASGRLSGGNSSVLYSDWDPGPDQWPGPYGSALGQYNSFISKFNTNGDFLWAKFQKGCLNSSMKADNQYIYLNGGTPLNTVGTTLPGDVDPDPANTFTLSPLTLYTAKFVNKGAKVIKTDVLCHGKSTGSATIQLLDAAAPLSYKWYFGNTAIASISLTPNQTNVLNNLPYGIVIGKIIDANGCEYSGSGDANGSYLPLSTVINQPSIPLSYSISVSNESCVGGNNNGTAALSNVQGGTPPYTYLWLNTNPVNTTSLISGLTAGNYTVVVSDSKGCNDTTTVVIQKDYNPSSFSYTTNGMIVNFSINSIGCNNFNWDFGNGNTSNINPNPVVTYASSGIYGVCIICNGMPPSCSQCINITVPGNTSGSVGLPENIQNSDFQIYPNPTQGKIIVEAQENAHITIMNSIGQIVYKQIAATNKTEVFINALPNGIYLVKVGNMMRKIMKE